MKSCTSVTGVDINSHTLPHKTQYILHSSYVETSHFPFFCKQYPNLQSNGLNLIKAKSTATISPLCTPQIILYSPLPQSQRRMGELKDRSVKAPGERAKTKIMSKEHQIS
jgi:hypothetical protein